MPEDDASSAYESPARPRTITKLGVQKNDPERANVFLDGEFAFGVHQRLILKHGLHAGRTLSPEEEQQITLEDAAEKAYAAALHYVAHKPRTEGEVRQKLSEKEIADDAAEQAVDRLRRLGYLDDAKYAREYVRGRMANKGYGPVRLRRELQKRGVDQRHIEDAFYHELDEEETLEAARAHARKKWKRLDPDEDPRRRRQKLYGYLRRRGFTSDTIRRVTETLEREAS